MRPTALAATLAVATLGALSACKDPVPPEEQITLTLAISQTRFGPDDPVTVNASLENESTETVTFETACGDPFAFEVLGASSDSVVATLGNDVCPPTTPHGTLALRSGRGATTSLGSPGLSDASPPLAAGTYRLRVVVRPNSTVHRSRPLEFTILSGAPPT